MQQIMDIGYFIKSIQEEKNMSTEKLCDGICSKGFFSEFTQNQKSMNKLGTDLLLQRLGLSEGDFENYMSDAEYKKLMMRYKIIDFIEKAEIQKAKNKLNAYRKIVSQKDKLHKRFILLMEARIMQLQNEDCEKIYLTLKEAVTITVPTFENRSINELILSYNELFFMVECMRFGEKAYSDNLSYTFYNDVLAYIEKNESDDIINAMLYPKVVCLTVKKQLLDKKYTVALKNCDKALSYLRKSSKLYFMTEVMENKSKALNGLIKVYENKNRQLEDNAKTLNGYKSMLAENEEQRIFLCELFREYNLTSEVFEWYPHNSSRELYSIGKIMSKRREMLNMSQMELSENICDTVTVSRIETGVSAPHARIAKQLLKKLGLFGELQMYVFECNSYEAYKLNEEMSYWLYLNRYEEAYKVLLKFKEKIDLSSRLNQQYLGHVETVILNHLDIISDEAAIQRYIQTLELTIPIESIFSDAKKYFSKRELMLINSIGLIYKKLNDYANAVKWIGLFENYYDGFDFDLSNYIITYEIVMTGYESLIGDMKEYDKSDKIAEKVLYESLKCRRGRVVGRLIYSSAWNMKERIENDNKKMQPHEVTLYIDKLNKALIMSCIMEDKEMRDFLNNKLVKINSSHHLREGYHRVE